MKTSILHLEFVPQMSAMPAILQLLYFFIKHFTASEKQKTKPRATADLLFYKAALWLSTAPALCPLLLVLSRQKETDNIFPQCYNDTN